MEVIKIKLSDSIYYDHDIDLSDIKGTNCYCDDEAMLKIEKRLRKISERGIHLIDSGNYHYMTLVFLKKIKEDFSLVVFDNHTDYKENNYSLISCGGWIKTAECKFNNLKNIYLVGVNKDLLKEDSFSNKVYTEDFLSHIKEEKHKIYISIDEDVLRVEDFKANWSQGEMTLYTLLLNISYLCTNKDVIGFDICGGTGDLYDYKGNLKDKIVDEKIISTINSIL